MKKICLMCIMFVFVVLCQSCVDKTNPVRDYGEPKQLISVELAKDLNLRYISERHKLISATIGKEDANAIWYSIEELENYINYAKTQGLNKGYEVKGIRFYLGVYPQDEKTYGEKAGLTTLFLAPTGVRKTQKAGILNIAQVQDPSLSDILEVEPLNFGTMGNPPKIEYGAQ
jgi:hypothetical protein